MFKKTGKIFAAILSLILAISMVASPVCAEGISLMALPEPEITPQWVNTNLITIDFSIDDDATIKIYIEAIGYSGTTFSDGTVKLTKMSGSNPGNIKTWSNLSSSTNFFAFDDKSLTAKTIGRYRVNFSITATRNGVSETIKVYKDLVY